MCEQKLLFVLVMIAFYQRFYVNAKICENVRVSHRTKNLENSLRGCTHVLGYLQVTLFEYEHVKEIEFPELTEITGFLLLYRVYGLTSIGKLFPNLMIIGGDHLFLDYAFVLYDLPNLQEIGLKSLRYVGRGSTRIERCPRLCYVNTIDWDAIGGSTHSLHYFNKNEGDCPSCPDRCEGLCWNDENCQNKEMEQCETDCLLCEGHKRCHRCKGYIDNEKCTTKCSENKYGHLPTHTCVTKEECHKIGYRNWFIFNEQCRKSCPEKYTNVSDTEGWCKYCGNNCTKLCKNAIIGHVQNADSYHGCTKIKGNLDISLHEDLTADKLAYGLGGIKIIDGYLRIYESHGITSLSFLKNLEVIFGNTLYQNKYSVVVFDNKNLDRLWDWDVARIKIKRGSVLFHYNPKLCRSEIEKFVQVSHLPVNYTKYDVSPYSNGEENICTVLNAVVQIFDVSPKEVNITWNVAEEDVIGYLLHYTEDPHLNVTIHEMQKMCQDPQDEGRYDKYVVNNKMVLSGLSSYTNYAFYIQISTVTSYFAGRTDIYRFRTKPGTPSVPQNVQVVKVDCTSIKLSWSPPKEPGGIVEQYEVSVYFLQDDRILIKDIDYCHHLQYLSNSEENSGNTRQQSCCRKKRLRDWTLETLTSISNQSASENTLQVIKLDNSTTDYTISNLQYYCNYILYLRVCNNIPSCSPRIRVYQRTKPYINADNIPPEMSFQIVDKNSVFVNWLPPSKPNSYIASYLVSYKNVELEHSLETVECVTVHQYAKHGGYLIKIHSPAKYAVTISAVSLAGIGKLSNTLYFKIGKVEDTNLIGVYLVLSGFIFGFIFIVFFYFNFKKTKLELMRIEKDVQVARSDLELTLDDNDDDEQPLLGVVRNGLITSQNRPCTVKFGSNFNTKEIFLNEVRRMRDIRNSHHVVTLLGLVWQQQQPLLIMELMSWGDLKSFLLNSRCGCELTEEQVIRMAAEIADGLLYLSSQRIVHPDLAARNCLVSAGLTVKVVNFGLNRDTYEGDYYNDPVRGVIPVRWMAPESITDGVITFKSNIWSYGIIMWEIVTAAEKPYEDLTDEEVMLYLIGQHTMKRPGNCNDLMYNIMCDCWKWKSVNRTNFSNILERLLPCVRRDFKLVSFYNSSIGVQYLETLKNKSLIDKDTIVRWKAKNQNVILGVVNEAMQDDLNLPSTSLSK